MVPPHIFGLRPDRPSASRIDIAEDLQVHVVADGKVIAEVRQIQTARVVVTELRHQQTARVLVRVREETKRDR